MTERTGIPSAGFWIFDESLVALETPTASIEVTRPQEIEPYARMFAGPAGSRLGFPGQPGEPSGPAVSRKVQHPLMYPAAPARSCSKTPRGPCRRDDRPGGR